MEVGAGMRGREEEEREGGRGKVMIWNNAGRRGVGGRRGTDMDMCV